MNSTAKRITAIVAWLLVVVTSQVLVSAGFAAPSSGGLESSAAVQKGSGVLATSDNRPITVNGASAITGATILTGATIETSDQVKATIAIPGQGTVEIAPNTKFTITFDVTGIRINLIQGCVVLLTMKGTRGEIYNAQGVIGTTDGLNDGRLDTCPTRVAAAAAAGAGGLFGLGTAATVALLGGVIITAAIVPIIVGGGTNPSPSAP